MKQAINDILTAIHVLLDKLTARVDKKADAVDATASASGLMSAADKAKLDGVEAGANAYTLPVATTHVLGGVKASTYSSDLVNYVNSVYVDEYGLLKAEDGVKECDLSDAPPLRGSHVMVIARAGTKTDSGMSFPAIAWVDRATMSRGNFDYYAIDAAGKLFNLYLTSSSVYVSELPSPVDLSAYAKSADVVAKAQGTDNAGMYLTVGEDGSVALTEPVKPYANAGAHNAIYRGKSLGTSVASAQYAAIAAGTFTDMYIGDYWTINSVNYRIAAFDYYYNCGDTNCTTHHVVLVPDTCLYNAQMNESNITTGGYVGSVMYTTNLETAKTSIKTAFSGHVLSHRIYLTNAISNGYASGGLWCDSEVDLMNENMVYGSAIFRPQNYLGATIPNSYTVEKSQLPLFAHEPSRICNRNNWWLRDVVSASYFAFVDNGGYAARTNASGSYGVRPAFCIC